MLALEIPAHGIEPAPRDLDELRRGQPREGHDLIEGGQDISGRGLPEPDGRGDRGPTALRLGRGPGPETDGALLRCLLVVLGDDHVDRVPEIHAAAAPVGRGSFRQDLDQEPLDGSVRLPHVPPLDHEEGPAREPVGQEASLLVSHVSRRGPDQVRKRMGLRVVREVNVQNRLGGPEQHLCDRTRHGPLPYAPRSHEQERPERPAGPETRPVLRQHADDRRQRVSLADDPFTQRPLEPAKPLGR